MGNLKNLPNVFSQNSGKYENNIDFTGMKSDIKPLALYLPQFHTFPENDEWWGKGFTEWTNVRKAQPLFPGHNEPRVPHDSIGYYDLSKIETLKKQVALAKQHGIYGFAIYYYWFSGKKLMEKPIDMLLEHKEIDFPFMLIWANENWTRTWNGANNNILIKQEYSKEDPKKFILDLKKYLLDSRYIKIDGKPVVGLYEASIIPDLEEHLNQWRTTARECGIGEIFILVCATRGRASKFGYSHLIDGEYEFPPRDKNFGNRFSHKNGGISYSYENLIDGSRNCEQSDLPFFRGSMLEWDNSARRQKNYSRWAGFSVEKFYLYNRINVLWSRKYLPEDKRFIFINAWNEWGEGTYLEPDKKNGFAPINAVSRSIFDIPFPSEKGEITYTNVGITDDRNWDAEFASETKICVQAHVFWADLISEITDKTNEIPYKFDLFITTTTEDKADLIKNYLKLYSKANAFFVSVVENKGRDVIPFISQLKPVIGTYKYFCHIHTKKSVQNGEGGIIWREYLFENLLGNSQIIKEILHNFEKNQKLGVVFPQNIDFIKKNVEWGGDYEICEKLMSRMQSDYKINREKLMFPAGNMFWGRTDALRQMFEIDIPETEIPEEKGQLDGTIMHGIERLWLYLADSNGYTYLQVRSLTDNRPLFNEDTFDQNSAVSKKGRLLKRVLRKFSHFSLIYHGIRYTYQQGFFATIKHFPVVIKKLVETRKSRLYNNSWNSRHDFYIPTNVFGISKACAKAQRGTKFAKNIKFSILVPLYNTPKVFLQEMIASVLFQTYPNWELCLADGSDQDHLEVKELCEKLAKSEPRIKYKKLEKNGGISENTNECIRMATGDYISLFDHDDLLHPSALYETMRAICEKNADFIYTDEAIFNSPNLNEIIWTNFKPDFAPDYFNSANYICHFTSFKKSLLDSVSGFDTECDGAQSFDLFLRLSEKAQKIVHIPKYLYFWRASKSSTAGNTNSKSYATEAGRKALEKHFSRINVKADVLLENRIPNTYKINYPIQGSPKISIIVYGESVAQKTEKCISSVRAKTTYRNYEVTDITTSGQIVDALNRACKKAEGDYLILLENKTEIISPNWIEEMLMFAQRNDVGAVGAKLYYPTNKIQHGGIILGINGTVGYSHRFFTKDSIGYVNRLCCVQNYSAVSTACCMVSRHVFDEINGLDESFEVAFNGVDMCMRMRKAGYLIVWTPYAELYHHESESRGSEDTSEKQARFSGEVKRFQERWAEELRAGDPYYNPTLTLEHEDFSVVGEVFPSEK